ncbi:translocation/assembly module TamB domain-containing protein [Paracoccus sp. (in: a-proteobacteria)]|uniref:translocation/assembly module TamB domain-containing protein n=1 Tax=Paracoccus sp. TaxID=267 RepID=UPI003A89C22B
MRKIVFIIFALLLPLAVIAQNAADGDDDKDFITRLLEKNLSGEGRTVQIDGFEGALSSRATFRQITIADADGPWLTLRDGAIQWTRSALLRGRVQIAELSAQEILLPRLPAPSGQDQPTAETGEFALPDLPVSVNIDKIQAGRVDLGQPVMGLAAVIAVDGSMSLADGEGKAHLKIDRVDGPRGVFDLDAGYAEDSKTLNLRLLLDEDADGLLVNMVNLHGKPAVNAEISGEGPLDGFAANLRLATDGQPRVTGTASLTAQADAGGNPGRAFRLELGGDVGALLPPDDRAFFGPQTQLVADGWRGDDGRLTLPELKIDTDGLDLAGSLSVAATGAPEQANLLITLGSDAGATELPVSLPRAGQNSTVESGRLELQFDAAQGQGWTLKGNVGELDQDMVHIGDLTLDGAGSVLLSDDGALSEVNGKLNFGGKGLTFADPGIGQAVGDAITGVTTFAYGGGKLEFDDLAINGADYGLSGFAMLSGLTGGLIASVDLAADYSDLSRLSAVAGRPVSGRADATVQGYYTVLTKSFDIDAEIKGQDITAGQDQLDRLLAGESQIKLLARRDDTGIELSEFSVNAQQLTAQAQGYLNSTDSDLTARISMPSLSGLDAQFNGALQADARLTGPAGARQLSVTGDASDLKIGIEALDGALQGKTDLALSAAEAAGGYELRNFRLANPQLNAEAQGSFIAGAMDATARFAVADMSSIMAGWSGGFQADARLTEKDGTRFIDLTGTGQNLSLGQQNVDGALTGTTDLRVLAEENGGVITLRDVLLKNDQVDVAAQGVYGPGVTDLTAKVDIASFASFGPGWRGSLNADASFREAGDSVRRLQLTGTGRDLALGQAQVDGALAGETRLAVTGTEKDGLFTIEQAQIENPRLNASATGKVGAGSTDINATLRAGDLRFLGNGIGGAINAEAHLTEANGTRRISASGTANGLSLGQDRIDPALRGQTSFDVAATQSPTGISLQRLSVENPQLRVSADGDPARSLNIDARLSDLALIQQNMPGPVQARGTLRQTGQNFVIDLNLDAPGNTSLRLAGTAAQNFSNTDLTVTGSTDASLANGFIRTRNVEGPIDLNLRIQGRPSLQALSGRVQLSNGVLADPGLGLRLENLGVTADFQNGRINLDGGANASAGGTIAIAGPVDLRAGTIDIGVTLDGFVARDPTLYETSISGTVRMSGRLGNGPLIAGQVNLGPTEIRIPSTGLGGAHAIPDIMHVGDTRPMRSTRAKAGLEPYPSAAAREAGLGGPPATPPANPPRLDLTINAPNQVFIRGRGVDAELGGTLRVTGTTRNVVPIGHLGLIRGRVDLLGKRFDLSEGLVELQGSLIPMIRLVAETSQDGVTTRIIIDGEARDPEISFESSPQMPEEEVLSQLLFGRGIDAISPLQAAQLANSLAVLAGRGGEGIVGRMRNRVGLDDLDLQTDAEGNVQVRAGKYLTEKIYTDVSVGDNGKTSVNLNLDISDMLRARGSVDSEGQSTLGLFFERDY